MTLLDTQEIIEKAKRDPRFLVQLQEELARTKGPPPKRQRSDADMAHFVGGQVLAPAQWRGTIIAVTNMSFTVQTGHATRHVSRNLPGLVAHSGGR